MQMDLAMLIFNVLLFLFLGSLILLIALSFFNGLNGYKKDNGHSDFVNSARWIDNK
jgi:hypothetical protein